MAVNDETVRFYDADDQTRHGFGDLTGDRERLAALIARTAARGTEVVLEVGCGTGGLSDLHPGWFGVDLGHPSLVRHVPGRSAQADARALPLASGSVTVVLTVQALEHVPDPEAALRELDRVLHPGGIAYVHPAWFCSPWPMDPLSRSTWGEVHGARRAQKLAGTLRYSRPARLPAVALSNLRTELTLRPGRAQPLRYGRLEPDLSAYQVPDADASATLEPPQVAAWFLARRYEALTFRTRLERLGRVRGPVVMRKPGSGESLGPAREAFRCPTCGGGLRDEPGILTCTGGHRFVVEGDVPRLLAADTAPAR